MQSTLLQVRVDEKTRSAAGSIFEKLGIDMPTAVRMFLARTILENGIPFSMKLRPTAPDDVLEAMKQTSQSAADAGVADMSLKKSTPNRTGAGRQMKCCRAKFIFPRTVRFLDFSHNHRREPCCLENSRCDFPDPKDVVFFEVAMRKQRP